MVSIITEEEVKTYSVDVKDMLARYYRYIDRFKDTDKAISFTVHGCRVAFMKLSGIIQNDTFIHKFLNNLDVMKSITENQPEYLITHTFNNTGENGEPLIHQEFETILSYDKEKVESIAKLKYRNASKPWYNLTIELQTK